MVMKKKKKGIKGISTANSEYTIVHRGNRPRSYLVREVSRVEGNLI